MKYTILEESSRFGLEEKVESCFQAGWKPQGGVSVRDVGFRTQYVQAMVKEE